MSVAVARIHGAESEYAVAAFYTHNVQVGLGIETQIAERDDVLVTGIPLLVYEGFNVIIRDLRTYFLHTIGATEGGGCRVFSLKKEISLEPGQYAVSEGLLVLGFVNMMHLRDHREIFYRTDLKNGERGKWMSML